LWERGGREKGGKPKKPLFNKDECDELGRSHTNQKFTLTESRGEEQRQAAWERFPKGGKGSSVWKQRARRT